MAKKRILFVLAAVGLFAASSWAQCSYATEDLTINFKRKIPGLLDGNFSVDYKDGKYKKVAFAGGNLQYNSDEQKWQFAENQWDYIGATTGNTSITVDGKEDNTGVADLFGWVGASSIWDTELKKHGLTSSTAIETTDGYGNVLSEKLKDDWGNLAISNGGNTTNSGWFTLKSGEWTYLLTGRPNAILGQVGSTYVRYAGATLTIDAVEIKGIIIFPDGYAGGTPSGVTWGELNSMDSWGTACNKAGWEALEAAGCVFLPAAGYRSGTSVSTAGSTGRYWSSSSDATAVNSGTHVLFYSSTLYSATPDGRRFGRSVRLVRLAE